MLEEFYYISPDEPTTHFRHADKANVVFCDGHVGLEKPLPNSLDTRLPDQTIGTLRRELVVPDLTVP
jgi:prepilin-type processing-associated H-X9-DG protein